MNIKFLSVFIIDLIDEVEMKYIVGNWKMHQNKKDIENFFHDLHLSKNDKCQAWIAPQILHFSLCFNLAHEIKIGAQNCHEKNNGAFTGEISALSLKDMGAYFVIIGHSERRTLYHEGHLLLNQKIHNALNAGLKVIFCIGETLEERQKKQTWHVLSEQLDLGLKNINDDQWGNIMIAYEPVWAIGTGVTATPTQAEEAHAFIKQHLKRKIAVLYGGSVKPDNIVELLSCPNIDGGLVGGASLKSSDFKLLYDACAS